MIVLNYSLLCWSTISSGISKLLSLEPSKGYEIEDLLKEAIIVDFLIISLSPKLIESSRLN